MYDKSVQKFEIQMIKRNVGILFKTNDFDIDVFDADTFSCILFCGKMRLSADFGCSLLNKDTGIGVLSMYFGNKYLKGENRYEKNFFDVLYGAAAFRFAAGMHGIARKQYPRPR